MRSVTCSRSVKNAPSCSTRSGIQSQSGPICPFAWPSGRRRRARSASSVDFGACRQEALKSGEVNASRPNWSVPAERSGASGRCKKPAGPERKKAVPGTRRTEGSQPEPHLESPSPVPAERAAGIDRPSGRALQNLRHPDENSGTEIVGTNPDVNLPDLKASQARAGSGRLSSPDTSARGDR